MTSDRDYKLSAGLDLGLDKFAADAQKARKALNDLSPAAVRAAEALTKLTGASTTAADALEKVAPAAHNAAQGARELNKAAHDMSGRAKPAHELAAGLDKVAKAADSAQASVSGLEGPKASAGGSGSKSVSYSGRPNSYLASDPEAFFASEMAKEAEAKMAKSPVISAAQARQQAAAAEKAAAKEALNAQRQATAESRARRKQEEESAQLANGQVAQWDKMGKLMASGFGVGTAIAGVHHFAAAVKHQFEEIIRVKNSAQFFGTSFKGYLALETGFRLGGLSNAPEAVKGTLSALNQKRADALGGDSQAASDFKQMGITAKELRDLKIDEIFLRMSPAIKESTKDAAQFARAVRLLGEGNLSQVVSGLNSPMFSPENQKGWKKWAKYAAIAGSIVDPLATGNVVGPIYGPGEYKPNSTVGPDIDENARALRLQTVDDKHRYNISQMDDYGSKIGELTKDRNNLANQGGNDFERAQAEQKMQAYDIEIAELKKDMERSQLTRKRAPLNTVNQMQSVGLYRGGVPDPGITIQQKILMAANRQANQMDRLLVLVSSNN